MLSSYEWWGVISNYNQTIFPMQLIVMLIGIGATLFLVFASEEKGNIIMKAYLSFCNLWMGSVFFIILGSGFPSPLKQIQGSIFILVGILFFIDIFTKKTVLVFPKEGAKKWITIGLLGAVACYPLVGIILGHAYDRLIYPGTLPCATTAFALVILAASVSKVNKLTYTLLLIWAIPFPVMIQIPKYHVYEDSIMFVIGMYALVVLIISLVKNRSKNKTKK